MVNPRTKGAGGEREVVKLIQAVIDKVYEEKGYPSGEDCNGRGSSGSGGPTPFMQRNQMQSHAGGYDLVGLDWLSIEVKRCETLQLEKWWQQTIRQTKNGQICVLWWRQSNQIWRVRSFAWLPSGDHSVKIVADYPAYMWLVWLETELRRRV